MHMLKDRLERYYLQEDMNCAETMLRAANEEWKLGLDEKAYRAVAGFGAGCGCGRFCGAVAGGLAALGEERIQARAHATPGFGEQCAAFVNAVETQLGSVECEELKKKYRTEQLRCLRTLELTAEVLQDHMPEGNGHETMEATAPERA